MFRRKTHKRIKSNTLFLIIPAMLLILFFYVMNFSSVFRTSMKIDWTGISQPIQDTLKHFVVYDDDYYVFEFDRNYESEERRKMKWVLKNATQDELYNLTNHPHGMVKVLSYFKLMNSDYSNKFEILKKAFSETCTFVEVKSGCKLKDFLLSEFLNDHGLLLEDGISPPAPEGHYKKLRLTEHEISILTEMLKNQIANRKLYLNQYFSDIRIKRKYSCYK